MVLITPLRDSPAGITFPVLSSPNSVSPPSQVQDNDHAPASPRNPHPSQGLHTRADWPQAHSPAPWTVPGAQSITSTRPGERQRERDWGALAGGRGLFGPPHPPCIKDRAHPAVALSPSFRSKFQVALQWVWKGRTIRPTDTHPSQQEA